MSDDFAFAVNSLVVIVVVVVVSHAAAAMNFASISEKLSQMRRRREDVPMGQVHNTHVKIKGKFLIDLKPRLTDRTVFGDLLFGVLFGDRPVGVAAGKTRLKIHNSIPANASALMCGPQITATAIPKRQPNTLGEIDTSHRGRVGMGTKAPNGLDASAPSTAGRQSK